MTCWFLLQTLNNNDKKSYIIINSKYLLDNNNLETVYLNRTVVKYRNDQNEEINGLVICMSEDLDFIQKELKTFENCEQNSDISKCIEKAIIISEDGTDENLYLVQYSEDKNTVILTVVNNDKIFWLKSIENEFVFNVFINDNNNELRSGTILQSSNDETELFDQLNILKEFCTTTLMAENSESQYLSNEATDAITGENIWLLIQYSCGINYIVYTVINSNETIWREQNQFNESVAYLTDGSAIYQGVIMKKSTNKDEIYNALNTLKEKFLNTSNFRNCGFRKHDENREIEQDTIMNIENNEVEISINNNQIQQQIEVHDEKFENNNSQFSDNAENILQKDFLVKLQTLEKKIYNETRSLDNILKYAETINYQMDKKLVELDNYLHSDF